MQVAPHVQQQVVLENPGGTGLSLDVGRQVVARVLAVQPGGTQATLALAGQHVQVRTDLPVRAGDTLALTVTSASSRTVTMTASPPGTTPPALPATDTAELTPGVSSRLASIAPTTIRELAREGVSVTPSIARDAIRATERLLSTPLPGTGQPPSTEVAARTVATLVARGIEPQGAIAARLATALELSGTFGDAARMLGSASRPVAATLPQAPPASGDLLGAVRPPLAPVEVALARIALAEASAFPNARIPGAGTPAPATAQAPASQPLQTLPTTAGNPPAGSGITPGQTTPAAPGSPPVAGAATQAQTAAGVTTGSVLASANPAGDDGVFMATGRSGAAQPQVAAADAQQAAGTAPAGSQSTPAPIARVITDIAMIVGRFASSVAPSTGQVGSAAAQLAHDIDPSGGARPGTFTPEAAGGGPAGTQAPLIALLRDARSGTSSGNAPRDLVADVVRLAAAAGREEIQAGLQSLTLNDALRIAGRLLDAGTQAAMTIDRQGSAATLRAALAGSIADLGLALDPARSGNDLIALMRAALTGVADHDPRPSVADTATRLLHALDGQQVLSSPKMGVDPGYVYVQVPMPGQRQAEVIIRRDPSRRTVTADTFDIAFLLQTQSLGKLMIRLEAHPVGVRATIRTDDPSAQDVLAEASTELRETVERDLGRPLAISVGVFEGASAPTSLLEPSFGLIPGENAYYA